MIDDVISIFYVSSHVFTKEKKWDDYISIN